MKSIFSETCIKKITIKSYLKLPVYLYQRELKEHHVDRLEKKFYDNFNNGIFYLINDPIYVTCITEKIYDKNKVLQTGVLIDSQHRQLAIKRALCKLNNKMLINTIKKTIIKIKYITCCEIKDVEKIFIELNQASAFTNSDFEYTKHKIINYSKNFKIIIDEILKKYDLLGSKYINMCNIIKKTFYGKFYYVQFEKSMNDNNNLLIICKKILTSENNINKLIELFDNGLQQIDLTDSLIASAYNKFWEKKFNNDNNKNNQFKLLYIHPDSYNYYLNNIIDNINNNINI